MLLYKLLEKVQDTPPCIYSRLALRKRPTKRSPENAIAPFLDIIRFTKNCNSLHHALLVICSGYPGLSHQPTQSALIHALVNPYISISDIRFIMETLSTIDLGREYENLAENVVLILEAYCENNGLIQYMLDMLDSHFYDKPLFVHKLSHQSLIQLMGKHQHDDDILNRVISVMLKHREKAWKIERADLKVLCELIKDLRRGAGGGAGTSRKLFMNVLTYLLWLVKGNSHGITYILKFIS
jgi:hypothetical protein